MSKVGNFITGAKELAVRVRRVFGEDFLEKNVGSLSNAKARLVLESNALVDMFKKFGERKMGYDAAALSYFCTMAFVPFVAVAFAVTNGFGLAEKLKDIILSAEISKNLGDIILSAADKILDSATNGIFGLVSALTFVWLVIWMMMRVETAFNEVWRVKKRPFFKSFGIDMVILVFAPFVILLLYSGTIVYSHVLDLIPNGIGITDSIKSFVGWLIACGVTILVFSAMFKYIPAAFVEYRYAFKAAVLAGIAFTLLQYLYLETQVFVMRINAVYGTIAAIPLFMVWMKFGWQIILYGVQFSCSLKSIDSIAYGHSGKENLTPAKEENIKV